MSGSTSTGPAGNGGSPVGGSAGSAAPEVLRIANVSGFLGDRASAMAEMLAGPDPVDVITGDWLAELTMLILARQQARSGVGWARPFVSALRGSLGTCLERGVKIVANAGGLDPEGCATAVRELAAKAGLTVRVATVTGDNLASRLDELAAAGERLDNLDTGETLADAGYELLTANAYLGGFGVAAALAAGADVVITGRTADAALILGAGAWRFGWTPADLDPLAGAIVTGHVLECGTHATGGNYAFFEEVPDLVRPGFPIAELAADGSAVITKQPGTGGLVSVGTVTAQLLYEIGGARYLTPDVVARFDTIKVEQVGADRVLVHGTRGEPAPQRLKIAANALGGYRNSMTLVVPGLDVPAKAAVALDALADRLGGFEQYAEADIDLLRHDAPESTGPDTFGTGYAELRVTVKDFDSDLVGRKFSNAFVDIALATYPGCFLTAPPGDAQPFGLYWPTTVDGALVQQEVRLDGEPVAVLPGGPGPQAGGAADLPAPPAPLAASGSDAPASGSDAVRIALGRLVGARSGDKGGAANIGLWAHAPGDPERSAAVYAWLVGWLTPDRVRDLLPEAAGLTVEVHPLPSLEAVNVLVKGYLGRGVAGSSRVDPQAKGLGEYLRAKVVEVPAALLPRTSTGAGSAAADVPDVIEAAGPGDSAAVAVGAGVL